MSPILLFLFLFISSSYATEHQVSSIINSFGQRLLVELDNNSSENVLISPLSISSMLSIAMAGAGDRTSWEILDSLLYSHRRPPLYHENIEQEKIQVLADILELRQNLTKRLLIPNNIGSANISFDIAESIVVDKNLQILDSFRAIIQDHFNFIEKDFSGSPKQATDEINEWVQAQTKTSKLFDQDLDSETSMILLSVVALKGLWRYPFVKESTTKKPFYGRGTSDRKDEFLVQMMCANLTKYPWARFADGDLLELPYVNSSLSMLLFLPKESYLSEKSVSDIFGRFHSPRLRSTTLSDRVAQLVPYYFGIDVQMPKFKIEQTYNMESILPKLSIAQTFNESEANFARITGNRDLFLSQLVHKVLIEVNEDGVELQTEEDIEQAFRIKNTSGIDTRPIEFHANRPFQFVVYDRELQVALLSGVVNKP